MGERPPAGGAPGGPSQPWVETRCSCGTLPRGLAPCARADSAVSKRLVNDIKSTGSQRDHQLPASPGSVSGLGAPQGAGSRILPRTHRVAERGHTDPASRGATHLSAPVCKWGLWLRESGAGGPGPPTLVRRSGVLGWGGRPCTDVRSVARRPAPQHLLSPAMAFLQPASKTVPGTQHSQPEGGKRKSPNTPPPGHGPLCLSFSSGNPSPGSKTGASVRETGLCSQGHAYFFKTCSIFARPRSQRPRAHGWMDGRTDGQGVVRSQDKHRVAPPARGPESRQIHGDGDRMAWPGAEGPGARGPWHSNLMGTEFQSGTAKTSWGQTAVTVATARTCRTPPRCALESGSDGEFCDVACVLRPFRRHIQIGVSPRVP